MSITQKARSGIRWGLFAKTTGQVFSWMATIIVIRILEPTDFALIALSDLSIGILVVLGQFGLNAALIRSNNNSPRLIDEAFTFLLIFNICIFLIIQLFAETFASFFSQPQLESLLRLSSFVFVFNPLRTVGESVLTRAMMFKEKEIVNVIANLLQIIANLLLALLGLGFWALAVGALLAIITRSIGYFISFKYLPKIVGKFNELRGLFHDSKYNFIHGVVWEIINRTDIFLINLMLNTVSLGVYTVVNSLAQKPIILVGQVVQQVGLVTFSKVSHDSKLVGEYVIKTTGIMCFFMCPVFFGIASISNDLVPLVLGPKWNAAVVPLQFICIVQLFNALRNIPGAAMYASGHARRKILHAVIAFIILSLSWVIGLSFGFNIACATFMLGYIIWFLWHIYDVSNYLNLELKKYTHVVIMPIALGAFMFLVIKCVEHLMAESPVGVRLPVEILTGIIMYSFLSMYLFKEYYSQIKRIIVPH